MRRIAIASSLIDRCPGGGPAPPPSSGPAPFTAEAAPLAAPVSAAFSVSESRPAPHAAGSVAVLLALRLKRGALAWGWSRIVLGAPRTLAGTPGLRFARALGSGHEGGFGLRPSLDRQGLFALFDDEPAARAFVDQSVAMARYRDHAAELVVALLRATSCRGSWGGQAIAVTAGAEAGRPVAALTRGAIRWTRAAAFWRQARPAQAALNSAPGCRFAVGLGEAPMLRQATFSLWDNTAAMDAYARQGAHAQAIRGAVQGGWFSESMFVRFDVLHLEGSWKGARID